MKRWLLKLRRQLMGHRREQHTVWEYKVVQMVGQASADPDDASRRLGGSLSAEALRNQFPEYYNDGNGRAQIAVFLNDIGRDGWELIQIQQIGALPLMLFKRPVRKQRETSVAKSMGTDAAKSHAKHADG